MFSLKTAIEGTGEGLSGRSAHPSGAKFGEAFAKLGPSTLLSLKLES